MPAVKLVSKYKVSETVDTTTEVKKLSEERLISYLNAPELSHKSCIVEELIESIDSSLGGYARVYLETVADLSDKPYSLPAFIYLEYCVFEERLISIHVVVSLPSRFAKSVSFLAS